MEAQENAPSSPLGDDSIDSHANAMPASDAGEPLAPDDEHDQHDQQAAQHSTAEVVVVSQSEPEAPELCAEPPSPMSRLAQIGATETTQSLSSKRKRKSRSTPIEIDPAAAAALVPKLEAVLISCDRPMQAARLAQLLGLLPVDAEGEATQDPARTEQATALIAQSVRTLNQQLESSSRSFRVELLSGGYRVMTLPEHADVVAGLHKVRQQTKLSRAAVESLAVIAYRQPVTRAELESIRGVSCGEVLRTLVERRLVTVKGRAEELGRPLIYGTTPQFLEHFGLASIKDLPSAAEGLMG